MTPPSLPGRRLSELVDRIERSEALDEPAVRLRDLGRRLVGSGTRRSLLSGTGTGHPVHPVLVQVPIGCWTSAMLLDLTGVAAPRASRRLVGVGVLAATPAVVSGLSDWVDTDGAESRVGVVHAGANATAVACFALSWWRRRRGGRTGVGWTVVGVTAATFAGWLGGHLAYGTGVGVDTNAFVTGPREWTAVSGVVDPDGALSCVVAGDVRIAAVATPTGVRALADRCSHRGGPLSEGTHEAGCLVCPWHGSRFDLESGLPVGGPATERQPVYETSGEGARLQVRRDEPRSLRSNPVRPEAPH